MSIESPKLGDKVEFSHYLVRKHVEDGRGEFFARFIKAWVPMYVDRLVGILKERPVARQEGVLVGVRQLKDGYTTGGYDELLVFKPKKYYTAYLVAFDMRRRPVFVLPEHIKFLEEKS